MTDDIEKAVEKLMAKDNKTACEAMKVLETESIFSPEVYPYFDVFVRMMRSKKSYERNRAFILIGANAGWDTEGKIDGILEEYLSHITDDKAISARQCLKGLGMIIDRKPQLVNPILKALKSADTSKYAESMRPLIDKDIQKLITKSLK